VEPFGTGQVDNYGYGDGMNNPPFGVYGGLSADGGALYRINADGTRTFFSMMAYFRVREGESWIAASTGGGGYGDPLERDPDRVRVDVRDGFVSLVAAERDYGVVLDPETLEVDVGASAQLRARLIADRGAQMTTVPLGPNAGTYVKALMKYGDTFELDPHPPLDADYTL
jgi:hypothetical protein